MYPRPDHHLPLPFLQSRILSVCLSSAGPPHGSAGYFEQRLQIRTISVRFAASVSLFLAGFERFAVQFRNQKTDQFQDRNVEMFYFRTPVVVFLV